MVAMPQAICHLDEKETGRGGRDAGRLAQLESEIYRGDGSERMSGSDWSCFPLLRCQSLILSSPLRRSELSALATSGVGGKAKFL
ncbi:hypothetical protein PYH37_002203 [Sinorhizobium numidicum]|uniref:Uncharacterized protein n=1 Tax=Sinorhizobium numidicum TaxID=680248 RepID=A0ABY8CWV7_9HYPH|nr:hypothetical protein [Sinorhizobium numidicum]WEX75805.1 hypothetical protein PYH37_002203 [Sinorhizobium numidicum]WEX81788.1 hypothetical protein PYH38_002205 [Sinorhizobium numidicum]